MLFLSRVVCILRSLTVSFLRAANSALAQHETGTQKVRRNKKQILNDTMPSAGYVFAKFASRVSEYFPLALAVEHRGRNKKEKKQIPPFPILVFFSERCCHYCRPNIVEWDRIFGLARRLSMARVFETFSREFNLCRRRYSVMLSALLAAAATTNRMTFSLFRTDNKNTNRSIRLGPH